MRLTRRGRLAVTLTVGAVALGGAAYAASFTAVGTALGVSPRPPCTLALGDTTVRWSRAEAMTATTVAGVGSRIGASPNGVAAAVARSLTGDREVAISPGAARQVYRDLPDVARPDTEAGAVGRALLGYDGAALTCGVTALSLDADLPREDPGALGLTPRADAMRVAMRAVWGKQNLGGFEPRGVNSGHIDGSAHYEGRAVDIFFRPVTEANQRRGWAQAQWAVAHADRLDVATVIFDRRIWTARGSGSGWRDYRYPGGATDNPVLLHEDHVHVDVLEGG